MKNRLLSELLSASFLVLLFTGCSSSDDVDDDVAEPSSAGYIRIEPSISGMTRTSFNEQGHQQFDAGDAISLYIWNNADLSDLGEGTMLAYNNRQELGSSGEWTSADPVKWKDSVTPHYFLGVYPERKITDFYADSYTLKTYSGETDPKIAIQLEKANDLMVAVDKTGRTQTEEKISLGFDHIMSMLVVDVTFGDEWNTTPDVGSILAKACSSADINYLGGDKPAVTQKGEQENVNIPMLIKGAEGGAYTFTSIMVPQTGFYAIGIPADGRMFTFKNKGDIALRAGHITRVSLVVRSNDVILEDISIKPWIDEKHEVSADDYAVDPLTNTIETGMPGLITRELINQARNGSNNLVVKGPISGADLRTIREATGCTYDGNPSPEAADVTTLDLSEAMIIADNTPYTEYGGNVFCIKRDNTLPERVFSFSKATSVILPEKLSAIETSAFMYSKLKSIIIPAVTKLEGDAFCFADELESVEFAEGYNAMTRIPDGAFIDCISLRHIEIPACISEIGNGVFSESGLESLTIPETVRLIGYNVLEICADKNHNMSRIVVECDMDETYSYHMQNCNSIHQIFATMGDYLLYSGDFSSENGGEYRQVDLVVPDKYKYSEGTTIPEKLCALRHGHENEWLGCKWNSVTLLSKYKEDIQKKNK